MTLTAADWTPGSGSSSFSFNLGKAGRNASGYRKNTLYIISTDFIRRYGLVELIWIKDQQKRMKWVRLCEILRVPDHCLRILTNVMISFAKSLDKSADMKQLSPLNATPASYWFCEFKSLRTILVANISNYNYNWTIKYFHKTLSIEWMRLVLITLNLNKICITSLSAWKHWHAAKYPTRLHVNLDELMTSIMLKPAQDISYPSIWI